MNDRTLQMLDRLYTMVNTISDELAIYESKEYMSWTEIKQYEELKIKFKTIKEIMGVA